MSDCEMTSLFILFNLMLICLQLMYSFMYVCIVELAGLRCITQVLYEPIS